MYVITNRKLREEKGLGVFGETPNSNGPLELRLLKVLRRDDTWQTSEVDDLLFVDEVKSLKKKFNLNIDVTQEWHGSLRVACELFERSREEKKSILLFVHGYNNDVEDVLITAAKLEETHGVIAVPFTWPANGGGALTGTIAYKSDKSDARASEGALNRTVEKIQFFHN